MICTKITVLLTGVNVYFIRLLFTKLSKKRASGREKNLKRSQMLAVDVLLVEASFDCHNRLKFSLSFAQACTNAASYLSV